MKTKIQFINKVAKEIYNGKLEYATEGSAGFDLRACGFYLTETGKTKLLKWHADALSKMDNLTAKNAFIQVAGKTQEEAIQLHENELNHEDEFCCLESNETIKIGTGIKIQPPQGYATFVYSRSGFSTKNEVILLNSVGVIDVDYTGEIIVCLKNLSDKPIEITFGDRIAQAVIQPILQAHFEYVEELEPTKRGDGGFGSTGK